MSWIVTCARCCICAWRCNLRIYACSTLLPLNLEACFIVSVIRPGETDCGGCDGGDRKSRWCGGKIGKRCGVFLTAICGSRNRIITSHSIVIFVSFTETCSAVGRDRKSVV